MANHEGLDAVLRYLEVASRGVFGTRESAWDSLQEAGGESSLQVFFDEQKAAAGPMGPQIHIEPLPAHPVPVAA